MGESLFAAGTESDSVVTVVSDSRLKSFEFVTITDALHDGQDPFLPIRLAGSSILWEQ